MPTHAMIYMTAGSEEEARRIVRDLVEGELVACGNLFPVQSLYRWEGALHDEREVAVIMKTRATLVSRTIERIRALHSYEVPCIAAYAMERGSPPYLEWVDSVTSPE